jgi:hypothetical protein
LLDQSTEPVQIDLIWVDLDEVSVASRHQLRPRYLGQRATKPVDVDLQVLDSSAGWLLPPQGVDKPGYGDELTRLDEQEGEH